MNSLSKIKLLIVMKSAPGPTCGGVNIMADKSSGIKRPLPAFVIFASEKRKDIHKPGMHLPESSKILSQMWKEMSDEDKAPYEELSGKDKQRYSDELLLIGRTPHRNRGSSSSSRKSTSSCKDTPECEDKPTRKRRKKDSSPPPARASLPDARSASLQNAVVPGFGIPVFTKEFLLHNKKLNSELMKLRQINKDLQDQKLRLEETVQSINKDIQRFGEMIEQQVSLNDSLDKNIHLIRKVVSDFLLELMSPDVSVEASSTVEQMLDKILSGEESLSEDTVKNFVSKLHDMLPVLRNNEED